MKKLLFIATLLLAVMQVSAANVDLASAQAKAQRFLQSKSSTSFTVAPVKNLELLHAETNSTCGDVAVYYIFNSERGFVIVSGDDRAQEILAYGDRPLDMKRLPDNMKFWLSTYKKQLEYLQDHPGLVVDKPKMKKNLQTATVAPMLTAEWDQDSPYYNHCPMYSNSYCLT